MEVFCPRCDEGITDIKPDLIDSGLCPTCSGQVYLGRFESAPLVKGYLAVLFEPGCNVGVPLELCGELSALGDEEPTSPNIGLAAIPLVHDNSQEPKNDDAVTDELEEKGVPPP